MPSPDAPSGRTRPVWLLPAAYLFLVAIGVPWYWPEGDTTLWLGMPAWLVTALFASLAVSALTAIVLRRPWPAEMDSPGEEEPR